MSSNNTTYNTSFDQARSPINSPHLGSPVTSLSPGTFKTNINRAKSQRWVDAKTVDYGGGGWGADDDFDDEDYDPYPPPRPMGSGGSGLHRSDSFDRGDDGLSPVVAGKGNGSAMPTIETTGVGIAQPLPPTPLELEQRERAMRGQPPPPHTQHQYPMQPKPQLSALPYIMTSATSSPARTPPLPVYRSASGTQTGSHPDPRALPDPPVKDKIPPPLGAFPNIPATPAPPPPPSQRASVPGRDAVPPPLGIGPGPSPVPQPSANFTASSPSFDSPEKPPPIRKDSPPALGGEISMANPTPPPTSSPSPPLAPQRQSEYSQLPTSWAQAPAGSPPLSPLPPPSKPVETSSQGGNADSDGSDRALFNSDGGVKLNDNQVDFQGRRPGHVSAYQEQYSSHSTSPESAYYPSSAPPPPQSASPEPAKGFMRPSDIVVGVHQTQENGADEGRRQERNVDMSPPESVTSLSYSNGPDMGRQSTDSLSLPGVKSPERIRESRENLGRPSSRQSKGEDLRPGSRSGSRPDSRNGSRSSRQGRLLALSLYPPPTGALPAVPASSAIPMAQNSQNQMDTVATGHDGSARADNDMSWNDDIISGYTSLPEGTSQYTSSFPTPPQENVGKASPGPTLSTNQSTPRSILDPEGSYPAQGHRLESSGFRSMVNHAFIRQDTLVPTPISPHRENQNSSPGDMVSPIFPRDIPLLNSPSPTLICPKVASPKSSSPVNAPVPPPRSPSPPVVNASVAPPKPLSPPIISNPTHRPGSFTPPGAAMIMGDLVMDLSRSSSPMNSVGPERNAVPVIPPVVPDGTEVELDQVTPVTAGPHIYAPERSNLHDALVSTSGPGAPQVAALAETDANSVASSPEKDDLDRFLGELVRANTPAPRSQTTTPQLPFNRVSMENDNEAMPLVPAVLQQPSPPQQFESDPLPPAPFQRPNPNRQSVGVLSLYDSYWSEGASSSPPPIQPKNPRRPSATLDTEAAKRELEVLDRPPGSDSNEQSFVQPQLIPSRPTVGPPTPGKKSGVSLAPVRIPDNNFPADSPSTTPASVMETPDSELMEMIVARKHYLARTQTGLSIRSDSNGGRITDDVMLRVKGDEMLFEKPDDVATPDVEFKGKSGEIVIGSEGENGTQTGEAGKNEESDVVLDRVIGPDSEGMEAIGGPTRVSRLESHEGGDDGEKTPMQGDFARELVNQFSRPQTLMLKDTMPMPSGVLVMPPMPPKEEGEEGAPEVVDFSSKDGDEELVVSETSTLALDKAHTQDSARSGAYSYNQAPGDVDAGITGQYMPPRDITRLPSPRDRIAAYDQTTKAISQSETGLSNWVNWMMEENNGEELLRIQVERRPGTAGQGLKKSTSRAFMGMGQPNVEYAPSQPPPQQHQQVVQPRPTYPGWVPRAQGHSGGEDDPRVNTNQQAPGMSVGPHVSPVMDKAKGLFNRLKKGDKGGQDGPTSAAPSQKGQQYPFPSTSGSLRTLASPGSFQNSFAAPVLVGVPPSDGSQNQASQGQVTPPHGASHQGHNNQFPPGAPPHEAELEMSRQQQQEYAQFSHGDQFQQGPMGPPPQQQLPQPDFTERFLQASQSIPPPPPSKDQPPQLTIPAHGQQVIHEGHPVMQAPQGAPTQTSVFQPPPQAAVDLPPAGDGSTSHPHGVQESIGHSQLPLTGSPPVGVQNTYSYPPVSQNAFPRRTDSLMSRNHGQNSAVNSPVTAKTPGRADSLTFVHDRLPSIRSDSLVSSIHPPGHSGRSDSMSSSAVNSPIHPTRSDSLSFPHTTHGQQLQNPAWGGSYQETPLDRGPSPRHQSEHPQSRTILAVQAEGTNAISRSFSDKMPTHTNTHDSAGVARSQSYHVGAHFPSSNDGQQRGFIYDRPGGPPEPIQENPLGLGKSDDDLYAPPARVRQQQQQPVLQSDPREGQFQQRPPQSFEESRQRGAGPGLGPPPSDQGYPSQQPREQNRFPGYPNQGPNQIPPQGYWGGSPGQQFQPQGPHQGGGPNPGQYQPGFQPRAAGYKTAQPLEQPPPQGQFRQVSPSAMGAPGSLLRQHGQNQSESEPEPKRNSTNLVKTLSNVSGRRQSTDASSSEFHRNSQGQYEPSTSSSQEKRRSSFFSSLSAKVEKTGRLSPSEKPEPKPVEKDRKRGTSFLKLKSKESKDKRNSGEAGGKPAHKKGFSIDVFGRTGSMLGKLSKLPSPSPKQQQKPQPPRHSQPQGPLLPFPQQQQGLPQQRQSQPQPIGNRPGLQSVGLQNQSAYVSDAQAYYSLQQQKQPQMPQGPPGAQRQQITHSQAPGGQAPPQIKTPELVNQPPVNQQQPLPRPNSQEPRYDPIPIPTGYSSQHGLFHGARHPGPPGFAHQQQPQPPQLQFPPSQSPPQHQSLPATVQQGFPHAHPNHGVDMNSDYGREHRLSVDNRQSPDLVRQGSQAHGTPPSALSPQLSRQGTQASHTRSVSPQISNADVRSVRSARMSSVSENPTLVVSDSNSGQALVPPSEGKRSPSVVYGSVPHVSPQSSLRESNRYTPPPQVSHTPSPQLAYPVASPLGLQQAMSEMEYEITPRPPTSQPARQPMAPSPIPADKSTKPQSHSQTPDASAAHIRSPPSTSHSGDKGKSPGATFYADDSGSSTKIDTPPPQQQEIPKVDYSQEKIAIQGGIEVESSRNDDSDDEPKMSATAYPGQAWDPGMFL